MEDANMQCVLQKVIQNQLVQLCHDIDGEQTSAPCWGIKPSLVGGLCSHDESQLFFSSKVIWDFFQVHVSHASSTRQSTRKGGLLEPFFSLSFQDNVQKSFLENSSNWVFTKLQLLDHVTKWLKLSSEKDIAEDSDRDAWGEGTKMFWFTNAMFRGACSSESTGGLANKDIQPWNFSMSDTHEEVTEGVIKFLCMENEKIEESLKLTQQKIIDIQKEVAALHEKRNRTHDQDTHQDGFGLEDVQTFWANHSELRHQRVQEKSLKAKERMNTKYLNSLKNKKLEDLGYDVLWQQGFLFVGLNVSERIAGLNLNKFFPSSERIVSVPSKDGPSSSERVVNVPSWTWTYRQMIAILSSMKPDDQFYAALSFDYYFLEGRKVSDCKMHLAFIGCKNGFWNRKKPWSKMFLIDLLSKKCFVELSSKKDRMEDSESFDHAIMHTFCKGVYTLWEGRWNFWVKKLLTKIGTEGVMRCEQEALFDLMRKQQNVSPASPFLEKYVYERGSDYKNPGRTLFDSVRVKGKTQLPIKCYPFAS